MSADEDQKLRLGVAAGALAALGYACTVIFGATLAEAGLKSETVLSIRFAISGVLLVALSRARGRSVLPERGERRGIFLLGAIGYMTESSFFFAAISRGSAGAVTVLFYVYPALVTLIESLRERRRPSRTILLALTLSVAGSALVAGAGGDVKIERLGVVFALCSALAFALYVTVGSRLNDRSDAMVTGAWVALGASTSFTVRALFGAGYAGVSEHWSALIGNGVANALAFGMMFGTLALLGPARATVVLTLEAVFTVILAIVFLDESLAVIQLIGAVAVLAAALTVARSNGGDPVAESAEATIPP
ncbi:MAG TPA: DMT family transporter [Acidimicrobiales bacterium]|nr:DMT family transporter [Acidimicrobiales bacterium]